MSVENVAVEKGWQLPEGEGRVDIEYDDIPDPDTTARTTATTLLFALRDTYDTLFLSFGYCVLTANIRDTHVRPHMVCPRPRCLYTFYLLTSRYGTCVISREERGRIRGN